MEQQPVNLTTASINDLKVIAWEQQKQINAMQANLKLITDYINVREDIEAAQKSMEAK